MIQYKYMDPLEYTFAEYDSNGDFADWEDTEDIPDYEDMDDPYED